jgi:hypothetical protein
MKSLIGIGIALESKVPQSSSVRYLAQAPPFTRFARRRIGTAESLEPLKQMKVVKAPLSAQDADHRYC